MENLRELEVTEMIQISGGSELAYDIGFALGCALRRFLFIGGLVKYFA